MSHAHVAGWIARPVDHQSSTLPLCYGCNLIIATLYYVTRRPSICLNEYTALNWSAHVDPGTISIKFRNSFVQHQAHLFRSHFMLEVLLKWHSGNDRISTELWLGGVMIVRLMLKLPAPQNREFAFPTNYVSTEYNDVTSLSITLFSSPCLLVTPPIYFSLTKPYTYSHQLTNKNDPLRKHLWV